MSTWLRKLYDKQKCQICKKFFKEIDSFGKHECNGQDHVGAEYFPVQLMTDTNKIEIAMHRGGTLDFVDAALPQYCEKKVALINLDGLKESKKRTYYFVIRDPKYDKIDEFIEEVLSHEVVVGNIQPTTKDC